MVITSIELLLVIAQCAPHVHPNTMEAIVAAESNSNPLAININVPNIHAPSFSEVGRAIQYAESLLQEGVSFDAGLAQINSANFTRLGLTAETVFDPCENLRASAQVLTENYVLNRNKKSPLDAALSMYNTGHSQKGIKNGYVDRVKNQAGYVVPSITKAGEDSAKPSKINPIMQTVEERKASSQMSYGGDKEE